MPNKNNDPTHLPAFVRPAQLATLLGVSTKTLSRYRASGKIPPGQSWGPRLTVWTRAEILELINTRSSTHTHRLT